MQDRSRKKRRRDPGDPDSPQESNAGSGPQRENPKHSRDNPVDDVPPSKRLKNGGEDLRSHETSDGTGAKLADDSQGATQAGEEAGKLNGDGNTEAKMQGSGRKANGPSNSHLLQKKSIRNAPQPSADSQPLRRSARIVARQEVSRAVPPRSGVAKGSTQRSRRRIRTTVVGVKCKVRKRWKERGDWKADW